MITKFLNLFKHHDEHDGQHGEECHCHEGHHRGHSHAKVSLFVALLGGVLVVNAYLAERFLQDWIDPTAATFSALAGALILSVPIIWTAVRDLVKGQIYMNELVSLALIACFINHDYKTAGAVAFFMLITIMIEHRTAKGAEDAIESLIRLTPKKARRLILQGEEIVEQETDALELQIGDIVRVRPGENFPADGDILRGESTVNQATITGESLPVDKQQGDDVFAGTQNLTGLIEMRVTRVGKDTTLGKVRDLIVEAEQSKLPIMRMIDRYVGYYTPAVLMIVALVWFFTQDLNRVISVLVMSCPCAIVLATPSAVVAAIAAASRMGILIKNVAHLELASHIKTIVFDKTGTLTEGNLEVATLQPMPGIELAELLQVAVSAEAQSNHPAARAMKRLAENVGISWTIPEKYSEVPGKGVTGELDGEVCRVGRAAWLQEEGLAGVDDARLHEDPAFRAMSIIWVSLGNRVLGWIGLHDAIRSTASQMMEHLNEMKTVTCHMVTGDNRVVAAAVAQKIGIRHVKAGCLPQEKVDYVSELKKSGEIVAVVGDGVNDAPALAVGDIGIAMGAFGSDIAVQSASIALMNNDLRRIPFFLWLARRAHGLMTENLLVGLGFIIGGICLAIYGSVNPILAALMHSCSTLIIIFNSARLVRAGENLMFDQEQREQEDQ